MEVFEDKAITKLLRVSVRNRIMNTNIEKGEIRGQAYSREWTQVYRSNSDTRRMDQVKVTQKIMQGRSGWSEREG